ncbi:hypothetical protein WDW86_02850 [Bdellovibrionota bacterium FG-2]
MLFSARILLRFYGAAFTSHPKKLWYLLPKEDLPEIRILYWSLICFFISELFCGIETYIIWQTSAFLRGVHAITSALGMVLFAFQVLEFHVFPVLVILFGILAIALRKNRKIWGIRLNGSRISPFTSPPSA